tara:strand:+ start:790 stop:1128 length:339 start_codon:yes stop_codon:yes gene_type:complete
MKQLITIKPDGSLFGLDHKQKGLQLKKLGAAKTKRATLIEFNEERQQWFIYWANDWQSPWTISVVEESGCQSDSVDKHGTLYWNEYEDAVDVEVAVIQGLQTAGELDQLVCA